MRYNTQRQIARINHYTFSKHIELQKQVEKHQFPLVKSSFQPPLIQTILLFDSLPFESTILAGSKRRRSRSPSDFERATNMALIYGEDVEEDQLEAWIQQKPFALDHNDTLIAYWLRQAKDKSTY
jgi:hypothetical protein